MTSTPAKPVFGRPAFTLVELLLVMALLTVVFAMSMPSLSRFFHGRALDAEARRFVSLTRHAQSRAASEGIPMELWVDAKQGRYGLQADPSYLEKDEKALEFALAGDLQIEVPEPPATALAKTEQLLQTGGISMNRETMLPKFRFLSDGRVDAVNPRYVELWDREGNPLRIVLNRNRMGYHVPTNNETALLNNER